MAEIRQLSRQSNPYHPTKKELWEWFRKINKEVFNGKIKKFRKVKFLKSRYMWAMSRGVNVPSKRGYCYHVDLYMKDSYPSKKKFIEVLAHEMVHAYQYLYEVNSMTHGNTFWAWKEPLAHFNITLSDTIGAVSASGVNGRKTLQHY